MSSSKKKVLWPEEDELMQLYKKRREQRKTQSQSKASVHAASHKPSVQSVMKTLQSQHQQQKEKAKCIAPKHRLRRRVTLEYQKPELQTAPAETVTEKPTPTPKPIPKPIPTPMSNVSADIPTKITSPIANSKLPHDIVSAFDSDGRLLRKIRRIDTRAWPVPNPDGTALSPELLFPGTAAFEVPKLLVATKQALSAVRDRLDPIVRQHGRDTWARHTAMWNPSGQVVRHLRQHAHVEMGTNSWTKLYEILEQVEGCISHEAKQREHLSALLLCEAPGAFVCALNHFVRTKFCDRLQFDWFASTLNPRSPVNEGLWMICDERFMRHTRPHWLFGKDDSGQLMDIENVRAIWKRIGDNKVDIVTADGSLDCTHAPNEQENIAAPLIFCETTCALGALRQGGTFILKVFTLLEHHSLSLMYLLACLFEELVVMKPFTARHANSELYVTALRFQGIDNAILERLAEFSKQDFSLDKSMFALDSIPQLFIDKVVETSLFFEEHQESAIIRNLELWDHIEPSDRAEIQRIRRQVSEQFLSEFDITPLQSFQRLVKHDHIDGARQPGQPFGPVHSGNQWRGGSGSGASTPVSGHAGPAPAKRPRVEPSHTTYSPVFLPKSTYGGNLDSPRTPMRTPSEQLPLSSLVSEHLPFSWARPDPSMRERLQRITSEMVGKPFDAFVKDILGVALEHENLAEISAKRYLVSWLPDTPLSLFFILFDGVFLMPLDDACLPVFIPRMAFPKRKSPSSFVDRTILCGHMVIDKVEHDQIPRFLVTDVIGFDSHPLQKEDLSLRLQIAKVELIGPLKQRSVESGTPLPVSLRSMPMWPLTNVGSVMSILRTLTHPASGISLFSRVSSLDHDADVIHYRFSCIFRSRQPNAILSQHHVPEEDLVPFLQSGAEFIPPPSSSSSLTSQVKEDNSMIDSRAP